MWTEKNSDNIIYIDRQTTLERPPDIVASNESLPFTDKVADTIFWDPPHSWGIYDHYHSYTHRSDEYLEKWQDTAIPRYYGWDVYKDRSEFIRHMIKTQRELCRVLKDDGLLWLKWNEMSMNLSQVLSMFGLWRMMMKLYIGSPSQTAGKHQTYWICLEKKVGAIAQESLASFPSDEQLPEPVPERPKSRSPVLDYWLRRP